MSHYVKCTEAALMILLWSNIYEVHLMWDTIPLKTIQALAHSRTYRHLHRKKDYETHEVRLMMVIYELVPGGETMTWQISKVVYGKFHATLGQLACSALAYEYLLEVKVTEQGHIWLVCCASWNVANRITIYLAFK